MRCLFCKQDSTATKGIEHIIPESLGNKTFVLPLGYVCDKCNNYFAREVEKPFLEQLDMRLLRFQEAIPNKKNRIPTIDGIFNGSTPVKIHRDIVNGAIVMGVDIPPNVFHRIKSSKLKNAQIIFPAFTNGTLPSSDFILSRFLAKMALEAFANKLKNVDGSLDELIDDVQFDPIRYHARLGKTKEWPCSVRRIYDLEKRWKTTDEENVQVIHESDFLFTNPPTGEIMEDYVQSELYFVVAFWGIEFAINMGGPEIEGYERWLREHNGISPLYYGKNKPCKEGYIVD